MRTEELKAIQSPLKERYKNQPDAACITLKSRAEFYKVNPARYS